MTDTTEAPSAGTTLTGTQDFWKRTNRLTGLLIAFGDHITDERCEICGDTETSEERSPRHGRLLWLCRRCCIEETGYPPKNTSVELVGDAR